MKRPAWPLGIALIFLFALVAPLPLIAQASDPAEAKKEAKAEAREARIQEYVRKKEQRLARREAEEARKTEEAAAQRTAETMARDQAAAQPAPQPVAVSDAAQSAEKVDPRKTKREKKARGRRDARGHLPRSLMKVHASLRASDFGQDPTVAKYLDLIETGEASAQQIAAFGNFLGQAARTETALAYYDLALGLDDGDTTIWLNAGTLQRQVGNLGAAAGAYVEVLRIDSAHAYAHYNLGAVLDEMGEYDDAIEEYKIALTLEPTLGDPAINPQAANNEKLMAVRMLLYKEQSGGLVLPLVTVPNGQIDGGK